MADEAVAEKIEQINEDLTTPGGDPFLEAPRPPESVEAKPAETAPQPESSAESPPAAETVLVDDDAITADDIKAAARYGIGEDEAKGFGNRAQLDRFTVLLDKRMTDLGGKLGQQAAPQTTVPKTDVPAQTTPAVQAAVAGAIAEYKPTISSEDYPELHAELLRMGKHVADVVSQKVQELAPSLNSAREGANAALDFSLLPQFDKAVSSLGPEYEPYLGKGDLLELDPAGDQYKSCLDVLKTAAVLRDSWARAGTPLRYRESIVRAAKSVLSDKLETITRRKMSAEGQKPPVQSIHRPSRPGTPVKGVPGKDDDALRKLGERLKARSARVEEDENVDRLAIY